MTYTVFENRDVRCAADVGRMAELGRFATEIAVYGTAVQEADGQIFYRATTQEENLYRFMQEQRMRELYYTPIVTLRERKKIPIELREDFVLDRKYMLLRQMKKIYENSDYFTLMQPFFKREPNNESFAILDGYRKKLEGFFDDTSLQLFWGLVCVAYEGKVLSAAGYQSLEVWYKKIRNQMSDDPVVEDNIGRTFYGFVYQEQNGTYKYVIDTQLMPVVYKRQEILTQGHYAGAIMQKTYWFQQFSQMAAIRKDYQQWLMKAQDDIYFVNLRGIKALQGVVAEEEAEHVVLRLKKYVEAQNAATYYFALWNKR